MHLSRCRCSFLTKLGQKKFRVQGYIALSEEGRSVRNIFLSPFYPLAGYRPKGYCHHPVRPGVGVGVGWEITFRLIYRQDSHDWFHIAHSDCFQWYLTSSGDLSPFWALLGPFLTIFGPILAKICWKIKIKHLTWKFLLQLIWGWGIWI